MNTSSVRETDSPCRKPALRDRPPQPKTPLLTLKSVAVKCPEHQVELDTPSPSDIEDDVGYDDECDVQDPPVDIDWHRRQAADPRSRDFGKDSPCWHSHVDVDRGQSRDGLMYRRSSRLAERSQDIFRMTGIASRNEASRALTRFRCHARTDVLVVDGASLPCMQASMAADEKDGTTDEDDDILTIQHRSNAARLMGIMSTTMTPT